MFLFKYVKWLCGPLTVWPLGPSRDLAASAGQSPPPVTSRGAPGDGRRRRPSEEKRGKSNKTGNVREKTRDFTTKYGEIWYIYIYICMYVCMYIILYYIILYIYILLIRIGCVYPVKVMSGLAFNHPVLGSLIIRDAPSYRKMITKQNWQDHQHNHGSKQQAQ